MKGARPTSGIVLQALFNILGPPGGRSFLDLFAGTGRVGKEALSRGFSPVVLVEISNRYAGTIERSIASQNGEVLRMDIRRALPFLLSGHKSFDVIFADPPYGTGWVERMARLSGLLSGIMKSGAVMVLEHSVRERIEPGLWEGWEISTRSYGESCLSFLEENSRKGEGTVDKSDVSRVI